MLETWEHWIAAFNEACETDDWTFAPRFLTEDVVYVVAGAPFACELRGRDAVVAGFRKSVTNFDRKFDRRNWEAVDLKVWSDHAVTALAKGDYVSGDKPPITFSAKSAWFFREGKISLMTDIYDLSEVNAMRALEWLARHGAEMDARYD